METLVLVAVISLLCLLVILDCRRINRIRDKALSGSQDGTGDAIHRHRSQARASYGVTRSRSRLEDELLARIALRSQRTVWREPK